MPTRYLLYQYVQINRYNRLLAKQIRSLKMSIDTHSLSAPIGYEKYSSIPIGLDPMDCLRTDLDLLSRVWCLVVG